MTRVITKTGRIDYIKSNLVKHFLAIGYIVAVV